MCSWYEASARATKCETCADQMTDSFQAHNLSQARTIRFALVTRLYCALCAVFMGVLSTLSTWRVEMRKKHQHDASKESSGQEKTEKAETFNVPQRRANC